MNSFHSFIERLKSEIIESRIVSKASCESFAIFPISSRIAYARSMGFLGCGTACNSTVNDNSAPEHDRIQATKLMLLSLYVDTGHPAWSSQMLERMCYATLSTPNGCVADLLHAIDETLEEYSCELTDAMASFINVIVVKCFSEFRVSYEETDFSWLVRSAFSPAQAYLALHAIPPKCLATECAIAILQKLATTIFWKEAFDTLGDELNNEKAKLLLGKWLLDGITGDHESDVRSAINHYIT